MRHGPQLPILLQSQAMLFAASAPSVLGCTHHPSKKGKVKYNHTRIPPNFENVPTGLLGILILTVAATNITAFGFLGIGKPVTSVRDSTFRIRSLTSSSVIAALCTERSSLSASHAVPCFNMPSQNATTAECGERNGKVAIGVGCKDPTMAACTPPKIPRGIRISKYK